MRLRLALTLGLLCLASQARAQGSAPQWDLSSRCTPEQMSTDASSCMQAALDALSAAGGGVLRDRGRDHIRLAHDVTLPTGTELDLGQGQVGPIAYGFGYNPVGSAGNFIRFAAQPRPGDTVTLNGVTLTFVAGTAQGSQLPLAASLAATLAATAAALNASTQARLSVARYYASPTTLDVLYKTPGAAGNAYTLAATSTVAGNAVPAVSPHLDHGGYPGLGGTIYLADGAQLKPTGNNSAIRNGIIVRDGLNSPPAGPGQVLADVAAFSGTAIAGIAAGQYSAQGDVALSNLLIVGFTDPVLFHGLSRLKLDHIMTDGTNGIDLSGIYDESYGSYLTSNAYYVGAYGGYIHDLDGTARSGPALYVHDGASGSKFDHVFDYGHAIGIEVANEFGVECLSCAKDGTLAQNGTGIWTHGSVDRFVFAGFRSDVQNYGLLLQGTGGHTVIVDPLLATSTTNPIRIDGPNVMVTGGVIGTGNFGRGGAANLVVTAKGTNASVVAAAFDANPGSAPLVVAPEALPSFCGMANSFGSGGTPDRIGQVCPGLGSMARQDAGAITATGPLRLPSYAFAALPPTGAAGRMAFCTNCRKPGERAHAGTGLVVSDDGHAHWVSGAGSLAAE